MSSLDRLVHAARRGVEERRDRTPIEALERQVFELEPIRPFTESIVGEEIAVVPHLRSTDRAFLTALERVEVAGLAVSAPDDRAAEVVREVAALTSLPILLKDVVVDPYQLYEGRLAGAHGVVLIAAAFRDDDDYLAELHAVGVDLGLDVVVEVRREEEVDHVLELLDPDSFLVRNTDDEGVRDIERTFGLLEEVPAGKAVLADGGVGARDDVVELARAGVDAILLEPDVLGADPATAIDLLLGDR